MFRYLFYLCTGALIVSCKLSTPSSSSLAAEEIDFSKSGHAQAVTYVATSHEGGYNDWADQNGVRASEGTIDLVDKYLEVSPKEYNSHNDPYSNPTVDQSTLRPHFKSSFDNAMNGLPSDEQMKAERYLYFMENHSGGMLKNYHLFDNSHANIQSLSGQLRNR